MLPNNDIIFVSNSLWEGPKRVRHNLLREFARRGHKVLFVEAGISIVKLIKDSRYRRLARLAFQGSREVEPNIYAAMMPPLVPGGEWCSPISWVNWLIVRFWMALFVLPRFPLAHAWLFLFSPTASSLIGAFNSSRTFYFCNDPFVSIFEFPSARKSLARQENRLTRKVEAVFAVSEQLVEERSRFNQRSYLVPLAANYELFSSSVKMNHPIPSEFSSLSHPIIAHIGVLNVRIDVDLVREIAELAPDMNFAFIGPVIESSDEFIRRLGSLAELKNVHFLANQEEKTLPAYLAHSDACMIPYKRDDITRYIKANAKFFQYVASGRPIVSTIGPTDYSDDIIQTVATAEEFVSALRKAVKLNDEKKIARRLHLAREHSWEARVNLLIRLIEENS